MATQPFRLLSGQWQLTGRHDLSRGVTQLSLTVNDLSLEAAAGIAGSPVVSHGTAEARIQLAMPNVQIQQAVATGTWSARDISVPPLRAEKARGSLHIAGGVVQFDDIQLEQADGRARARVEFRLDRPQDLAITLTTQAWPIRLRGRPVELLVDSQADLQVDAGAKSAQGQARLAGRVLLENQDIARISTAAFMERARPRFRWIDGRTAPADWNGMGFSRSCFSNGGPPSRDLAARPRVS
jgi:hypothetical protein